ncbi:MAG TPA: VWA domain-containing protein [Candidatus Binataceae bacterium]|nr:VWA domain-containing protein [Candidatus Binataceae bacterium]
MDLNSLRELTLQRPGALYLLAIPLAIGLWGIINAGELRRWFAPIMRAAALALFVLAIANPQRIARTEGSARPAVVDASNSITPAMRQWGAHLLADDLKLRAGDPGIMFGGSAETTTIGEVERTLAGGGPCDTCAPDSTDLESALQKLAADPDAAGGPAVLVTDGWENRGDSERAVSALLAAQIRLDIFTPPGAESIPNVAMTELTLPSALAKAAPFALGVTLQNLNSVPVAGTITVSRGETQLDSRKVTLPPGSERFDFPIRTEAAGLASYSATFKPDNPALDRYTEDDSLQGWVGVGARRKVLIISDSAKDASYLETVARELGLEPTVATGRFDGSTAGYDAILLNNIAAAKLAPAAQASLVAYVERGGALAMVGGDQSFGLGGWEDSPVAKVMPVVMKPPEHKERRRALVVIIDKSGSMGRAHKLQYAKAAAETVSKTLKDDDLVCVLGFDTQPFEVIPLEPMAQARTYFDQMVSRLTAHGETYLLPALKQAEATLAASGASLQHVVVITDGETGGTIAEYYDLVSRMRHEENATVSTIGIGNDVNVGLLQNIAKYGGGSYYQTDSAHSLPEIVVEDFQQHGGESTMVENQFSPRTVKPDPVLKDLAGRQLPPIKGYVSTELKPRATLSAFVDRGPVKEPLIASWQVGAGKALAVTTDASGRWSGEWVRSNVFTPVWNRIFGWMTPETAETAQQFDVALGYQSGRIRIKLTDYETSRLPQLLTVAVLRPDATRAELPLDEPVTGEFSGSVDAPVPGTYYFEIRAPGAKERTFPPLAYTVSPAVLAELPRPVPNYGDLERLASATGGRLNPSTSEIAVERPTLERRASLNPFLIVAAMLLLIGEALVRRLNA